MRWVVWWPARWQWPTPSAPRSPAVSRIASGNVPSCWSSRSRRRPRCFPARFGSVLAGLASTGLPARFGYERRLVVFAAGLRALFAPLLLVDSLAGLVTAVTALGFAVAPYMISCRGDFRRVGRRRGPVHPPSRDAESADSCPDESGVCHSHRPLGGEAPIVGAGRHDWFE